MNFITARQFFTPYRGRILKRPSTRRRPAIRVCGWAEAGNPCVRLYLIENGGQTAGYALLALTFSNEAGGDVVWLDEIYIRPEFQGKGLGNEFFDFLEKEFASAARFRLEVESDNEGAVRLYKRRGFRPLEYVQFIKGE